MDSLKSKSTLPGGTPRTYPWQAFLPWLDVNGRFSGDNKYIVRDYLWPVGFQILHQGITMYLQRLSAPEHEMVIMR